MQTPATAEETAATEQTPATAEQTAATVQTVATAEETPATEQTPATAEESAESGEDSGTEETEHTPADKHGSKTGQSLTAGGCVDGREIGGVACSKLAVAPSLPSCSRMGPGSRMVDT